MPLRLTFGLDDPGAGLLAGVEGQTLYGRLGPTLMPDTGWLVLSEFKRADWSCGTTQSAPYWAAYQLGHLSSDMVLILCWRYDMCMDPPGENRSQYLKLMNTTMKHEHA